MVRQLGGSEWSVRGLGMGLGTDSQVHICGLRGGVGVSASDLQRVALCCSLRLGADGRDASGDTGSSGSGAEHPPTPPTPICKGLHKRPANAAGLHCFSQNPAFTLPASELLLVLFFFLRLFCPRLRIRETTEKPTPMQTHEGLFTSSSLYPSTPDIAEQGLGPRRGF